MPAFDYLNNQTLIIDVASGTKNAKKLMKQIVDGTSPFYFTEIMRIPPAIECQQGSKDPNATQKRLGGLFAEDHSKSIRKSHENAFVRELYEAFLISPNSHIAMNLYTHIMSVVENLTNSLRIQRNNDVTFNSLMFNQ